MTGADLAAARLVRVAFMIRAGLALGLTLFTQLGLFAPDEQTYSIRGDYVAQFWRGTLPWNALDGLRDTKGYYYVVAAVYFPFGAYEILPRLLNAWVGSLAVMELFRVTRLISGSESAALRAAKFMTYFPSMILWSALIVRDVWVQWLLVRVAREMAELKGRFIFRRIISILFLIWLLTQFRSYLLYAAIGPFLMTFVLSRIKDIVRNTVLGSVFALSLVALGSQAGGDAQTQSKIQTLDLVELQRLRTWSSGTTAGSGFANEVDVSSVGGAITFLPIGLTYFFFAPFPWQLGSLSKSMAIPETLFFYTLVPGIIAGITYLFRYRLANSIGVLLVTMTVTFGYAVGQGNVGTLYRHKAQVMGFYYAFAAVGMENRRRPAARSAARPFSSRPPRRVEAVAAYSARTREI